MPAKCNLVVGEAAFGVDVPERPHPIDDKALLFDRGLEALQTSPRHIPRFVINAGIRLRKFMDTDWMAMRVPSATRMKSCKNFQPLDDLFTDSDSLQGHARL